jgi:CheY-like chemotaxis protein
MASQQQLIAYINQYKARYSVAALKSQLLKQGIPEGEVDQAIRAAMAASPAGAPAPGTPPQGPAAPRPGSSTQPPRTNPPTARPPGQATATPMPTPMPGTRQPWPQSQTVPPWQSQQTVPPRPVTGAVPGTKPPGQGTPLPQPPGTPPPGGAAVKPPAGRTYILVVDDDQLIRDMLVNKLEGAGYRVTCAEDAAQSVIQAEGMRLAILISDIEMPGFGTGVDALKKLRASNFVKRNLPVIFVTGMPPNEARKIVPLTDPYVRLMHKPVDWNLLRLYIRDLTGMDKPL